MHTLLENDFYVIEHDAARKLVIMRRTSVGLSVMSCDSVFTSVLSAVRSLRGQRLLSNVRLAPGNNDPILEQKIQQFRRRLSALFPVTATVAATAVGRLQIARMSRERQDSTTRVFLDEAEALAHLMAQRVV